MVRAGEAATTRPIFRRINLIMGSHPIRRPVEGSSSVGQSPPCAGFSGWVKARGSTGRKVGAAPLSIRPAAVAPRTRTTQDLRNAATTSSRPAQMRDTSDLEMTASMPSAATRSSTDGVDQLLQHHPYRLADQAHRFSVRNASNNSDTADWDKARLPGSADIAGRADALFVAGKVRFSLGQLARGHPPRLSSRILVWQQSVTVPRGQQRSSSSPSWLPVPMSPRIPTAQP
jgi:hypothetical protein